jgi:[acyl-carrier-protein] S-malonyltransferase
VKACFLFPGQGARNVLAGVKLAGSWPEGAQLLAQALAAVKLSAAELEAQAGRALERTDVLQPVLAATCLAIHGALLRAGIKPSVVLGHSLGELPAFAAAGVLTAEATVKLAALRGALMAREAAAHPGGLIAVSPDKLPELSPSPPRGRGSGRGLTLQLAAFNAPDEVVLCGPEEALRTVAGGRRVPVSGPWHGDSMAGAVDEFRAALEALAPSKPTVPLVRNLDGALADSLDTLADQLTRPVQFISALETVRAQGVDVFVTVGPGAVLRGLVRKNLGTTVRVLTTEDAADFERTLSALKES